MGNPSKLPSKSYKTVQHSVMKTLEIRIVRSNNQNYVRISSISYNLSPVNLCKCTGATARAVLLTSAGVSF